MTRTWCYAVVLDRSDMVRSVLGWCQGDIDEDGVRGKAVASALKKNPGFTIHDVLVMEIPTGAEKP